MSENQGKWALILGASSGFGAATAREFARAGWNIIGVHLDRRGTMALVEEVINDIRAAGVEVVFHNVNAADEGKRKQIIAETVGLLRERGEEGRVVAMLHSLAFGAIRAYVDDGDGAITPANFQMTMEVMANSLVYWTQDLISSGLMTTGGRIYAMTSSGTHRVIRKYGAISMAKAALEANIRQLAVELATHGITANAIQAGVTDTPALRKIPDHPNMIGRIL
ncbi:MAG: SDR family oxidoreductase, partial [bacterium]